MRGGPLSRRRAAVAVALVAAAAGGVAVASGTGGSGGAPRARAAATRAASDAAGLTLYRPSTSRALAPDDPRQLPLPRPGVYGGRLLFTDTRCRLRAISLATTREVSLPGAGRSAGCVFWPSANGRFAASAPEALQIPLRLIALGAAATASGTTEWAGLRLGATGTGPPAVTDDGRAAVCVQGAISAVTPATAHVAVFGPGRATASLPGCHPVALGDRLLRIGAAGDLVDERGATVVRFRHDDDVGGLAASADGSRLGVLARGASGVLELRIYDAAGRRRGTLRDVGRGDIVFEASFSADGRVAVTSTPFGWQASTAAANTVAVGSKRILGAAAAPDGRAVAAVTPDAIVFLQPPTLRPVAALPIDAQRVVWLP